MAAKPRRPAAPCAPPAHSPPLVGRVTRRRRPRDRGQIVPLVALLMIVITGFAALAIDSGVSYDQSRIDQDVADAGSLAASYCIFASSAGNCDSGAQIDLQGAYAAAANVTTRDCTTPASPCTVSVSFCTSLSQCQTGGTPACTATSSAQACLAATLPSTITYVGASVSTHAVDYFANLDPSGSRTHLIAPPEAIAQVKSGDAGAGVTLSCEICDLGPLTIGAKDASLISENGPIIIDGVVTIVSRGDCIYASSAGSCSSPGGNPYSVQYGSTHVYSNTPTVYPAYTTGSVTNPMASVAAPGWSGLTNQGSYSAASCANPNVVPSGIYSSMTLGTACTYDFSGNYVITGEISVPVQNVTMSGTGVNFYFTCGTSAAPQVCASGGSGGWMSVAADSFTMNLAAATTGTMENILFYFDPNDVGGSDSNCTNSSSYSTSMSGYCGIDVSAQSMGGTSSGALYMAGATLRISAMGSGVFQSPIVAGGIYISAQGTGVGSLQGGLTVSSTPLPGGLVQ